jgi:hypothetical protein
MDKNNLRQTNKKMTNISKALQKMEFTKLFVFASFGIVWLPKFGNF